MKDSFATRPPPLTSPFVDWTLRIPPHGSVQPEANHDGKSQSELFGPPSCRTQPPLSLAGLLRKVTSAQ